MINKKLIILSSVLLIFLIGTIFVLNALKKGAVNNSSANKTDSGMIVAVVEKPFYVEITSNPSTGYQWQADFDTKIIKLVDITYSQNTDPNIVGTEVLQIFQFQPLEKGDTLVKLRYVRPWEENTTPIQTKEYLVSVK